MTSDKSTKNTPIIAGVIALLASAVIAYAVFLAPQPKAAGTSDDLAQHVKSAIDGHVLPRMQVLAKSTQTLAVDVGAYCDSGSGSGGGGGDTRADAADDDNDAWKKLKSSLRSAVMSWAQVDHLRFGPLTSKARAQRISFWPDPRAIIWRQLRPVLAKQDGALLAPGALADQSVALQGLTALEYLIEKPLKRGKDASQADLYRCSLAHAIAKNVAATSQAALDGWTKKGGWRDLLLNPGPNNKVYKTHEEAAAEFLKSAMLGFQLIRDQQVVVLQEIHKGKNKLSRLPYYRSGLSKIYLKASISSSCEFVEKLNLTPFAPPEKKWILTWLPNGCRILNARAFELLIPQSPGESFEEKAQVQLRHLHFYANGIRQIIGRDIAPAAGLTIGFNELDGD